MTDAEIPEFVAALDGELMGNAYALCLFAGLREGECLGLSWKQVGSDKGTITINQQLQKERGKGNGYVIREFTKSNKPRTIKLPAIPSSREIEAIEGQIGRRVSVGQSLTILSLRMRLSGTTPSSPSTPSSSALQPASAGQTPYRTI